MDEYRFDHLSNSHGSRHSRTTTQWEFSSSGRVQSTANTSLAVIPNSPGLSSIASNPTDRPPLPNSSSLHTPSNTTIHQINSSTQHQLEEIQEKQRLEKQNFELKMKIYHLEDTIHSFQEKEIQRQATVAQNTSEINDLKLLLEERNLELEERNLILIKAKNAMEILKTELQRSQLDAAKQSELQEKVHSLKQMNEEIERDYKQQLTSYEQEIKNGKSTINLKEQEIAVLEDQIKQLEITIERMKEDYDTLMKDKDKIENIWISAQERISLLEEEVTQCHAHIDLFKIRVQEEQAEKQNLQMQIKDVIAKKAAQEEDHKHRVTETNQQYEMQIRTMRSAHEQEIEKIRAEHLQLLSDMRENYHQETHRTKAMYDQELQDLKSVESSEKNRQREDFMERLAEKNDEIRALKAQIETQQQRYERLVQENEMHKSEVKDKQHSIETARYELHAKSEEVSGLLSLKETIHTLQQRIIEMQEIQKKENIEKLQLSFQKDTLANQIIQLEKQYKDVEAEAHLLKIENSKLSYATSDLTSKKDSLESISREIDKYKIIQQKLSNEILEAQYKHQHLLKEQENLQQEHARHLQLHKSLQEELKHSQATAESLQAALSSEKEAHRKEGEKRAVAESLLSELRQNYSSLKVELEEAKNQAVQSEEETLEERERWKQSLNDWISIYLMMLHALQEWDESLVAVVDGESAIPASSSFLFPQNNHHTQSNSLASWLSSQQYQTSFSTADLYQSRSANRSAATPHKNQTPLRSSTATTTANGRSSATATTNARGLGRAQSPTSRRFSSSSSAIHRPMQSSFASMAFNSNNEFDYYLDMFVHRIQEAKQEIAVGIERIALKQEKIQNLRSFYISEQDRVLAQFSQFSDRISATLSTAQEQINHLSSELLHCQKVMSHDQQVLQQERQDFQALKEVLLKEHQEKYHALEVKYTEVCIKLESSQRMDENHQKQLQQIMAENKDLNQTIIKYKKDLQQIQQLEDGFQQFHAKYDVLQKQYQQSQLDIQKLQASIHSLQSERAALLQEKQGFAVELDRWKQQCGILKEEVFEGEKKFQLALMEVDKLQARPIDPDLALKLLSFHQRDAVASSNTNNNGANRGGGGSESNGPPSSPTNSGARNMFDLVERLSPVRSTRSDTSYLLRHHHRNLTSTSLRGAESIYFPSRRGLMSAGTERFESEEGLSGVGSTASYLAGGLGGAGGNSSSNSRLSNIDRSLQALAKKLEAFDKSTA